MITKKVVVVPANSKEWFELELIELTGLPVDCRTHWSTIYADSENHIHDEDMIHVVLSNGVVIDAGQYGEEPFFKVVVVPANSKEWFEAERVICRTTQEVANEVVRLANKYTDPWYANVVNGMAYDE
jgi:hypothetical protein